MKKLVQTGEDNNGVFNVMDGLSFVQAFNENANELGTSTKLDLEVHNTPEAVVKALREQTGKGGYYTPGGPDDLPTFEEQGAPKDSPSELKGGIAQVYNEAIEEGGSESKVVEVGEEDLTLNFKSEINSDLIDIHAKLVNDEELTEEEAEKLHNTTAVLVRDNGEVQTTVVAIANPRQESFIEIESSDRGNPETALYISTKTKDALEDGYDADVTALTKDGWYTIEPAPRDGEHEHEHILVPIEEPVSVNFRELTNIYDADGNKIETYDMSGLIDSAIRPTYAYKGGNYRITTYDTYDKEAVDEYTDIITHSGTLDYGFSIQGQTGYMNACEGEYAYIVLNRFLVDDKENHGTVYAYLSPVLANALSQHMENIDISEVTDYGWYETGHDVWEGNKDGKLVKSSAPSIELYGIGYIGDPTGKPEKTKVDGYIKTIELVTFEDVDADFTFNFNTPQEISSGIYMSDNEELVNSFAAVTLGNYPETKDINDLPFSSIVELKQGDLSLKGYVYLTNKPEENYYKLFFAAKETLFSFSVYLDAESKGLEFKPEDDNKNLLDTLPEFNWHNTIPH